MLRATYEVDIGLLIDLTVYVSLTEALARRDHLVDVTVNHCPGADFLSVKNVNELNSFLCEEDQVTSDAAVQF